jgi:hypothetical protein
MLKYRETVPFNQIEHDVRMPFKYKIMNCSLDVFAWFREFKRRFSTERIGDLMSITPNIFPPATVPLWQQFFLVI